MADKASRNGLSRGDHKAAGGSELVLFRGLEEATVAARGHDAMVSPARVRMMRK